jgi:DNA polymerase-1
MPSIPPTGWKPPRDFPNLSAARAISLDTETYDPRMETRGPGWASGDGHIIGVSLAVDEKNKWYFPVRHTVERENNLNPQSVFDYLRDTLKDPRQSKIGANLIYDLGWLKTENVHVAGQLFDVQFAEALISETAKVGIDTLAEKYLNTHKVTSLLYQWLNAAYGGGVADQRKNLWRSPPSLCGPYAEADASIPLSVLKKQWPILERKGLKPVFCLENRGIPLLIDMRLAGCSVDIPRAEQLYQELTTDIDSLYGDLKELTGLHLNVNAPDDLKRAFDVAKIKYPFTEKTGKPSFAKKFLESQDHPLPKLVVEIRALTKLRDTFVKNYILDNEIDGKIYCEFHPLRGDDYGTRSGRYSSTRPNLQNIPIRTDRGKQIRSAFIPDKGHKLWRSYDYSQIEYRLLAHFAMGPGSDELRQVFVDEPKTDYHALGQKLVEKGAGKKLDRKPLKNINFGIIYGMGESTLATNLGVSSSKAKQLFEAYHKGAPYVLKTMEYYTKLAENTGVITTLLGRQSQFDLWEPSSFDDKRPAMPLEFAAKHYGNIKRAGCYKALNRLLQGSAADFLKMATVMCYEEGVFKKTGVPRLTVHDELNFSDPDPRETDIAFRAMADIMETAIKLKIPILVDQEVGPNWGQLKGA